MIRLWSVQEQRQLGTLNGHESNITSLSFAPDGSTLASGSMDNTVRIWDTQSQEQITVLTEHKDDVVSVAFSPDGRWLASGSKDGTVLIWKVNIKNAGVSVEPPGKCPVKWGEIKKRWPEHPH